MHDEPGYSGIRVRSGELLLLRQLEVEHDNLLDFYDAINQTGLPERIDPNKYFEDLGCIYYLYLEFFAPKPRYSYILLDEAQYLSPVWVKCLFKMLMPGGRLNLCGDVLQRTYYSAALDWQDLCAYMEGDTEIIELNTNYRTTDEIVEMARWSLEKVDKQMATKICSVGRHGAPVSIINDKKVHKVISNKLIEFSKREENNNYSLVRTVGIICPTADDADDIEQKVKELIPLKNPLWNQLKVDFLCITDSGGLEFDAVIISEYNSYNRKNIGEASMLYTAITRAAHELVLIGFDYE